MADVKANKLFYGEMEILKTTLDLKYLDQDEATIYLIKPYENAKETRGINLTTAITNVIDTIGWFVPNGGMKGIKEQVENVLNDMFSNITHYIEFSLKHVYLYRKNLKNADKKEPAIMEYAIGLEANFLDDGEKFDDQGNIIKTEEKRDYFPIKKIGFTIWSFSCEDEKEKAASEERKKMLEEKLGLLTTFENKDLTKALEGLQQDESL